MQGKFIFLGACIALFTNCNKLSGDRKSGGGGGSTSAATVDVIEAQSLGASDF